MFVEQVSYIGEGLECIFRPCSTSDANSEGVVVVCGEDCVVVVGDEPVD